MTLGKTNVNLTEITYNPYRKIANYDMLYYFGDECEEVTGGWVGFERDSTYTAGDYEKRQNNLYVHEMVDGYGQPSFSTTKPLDMTQYTMMAFKATWYGYSSNGYTVTAPAFDVANASQPDIRNSSHKSVSLYNGIQTQYSMQQNTPTYVKSQISVTESYAANAYVVFTVSCGAQSRDTANSALYALALFKADDIETLAAKAGITNATIDNILANSSALFDSEDTVYFMVAQCTGDFMASAVANSTFLNALNNSPYKTIVQSNKHWAKFLAMVA